MRSTRKTGRLVRSFIAVKSRMTEVNTRMFRDSPVFTRWTLVRVLAVGALLFAVVAMYLNMTSEGAIEDGSQSDHFQNPQPDRHEEKTAESADQVLTYPSEGIWIKAGRRVQVKEYNSLVALSESPWQEEGLNVEAQKAAQQKLMERGFATATVEQFQALVSEAADAGHGQLLLQAGFTEQQVRNAQERQRKAYEETGAESWFRLWALNLALIELRRRGLADSQGYLNVKAAADAGFENLLLNAGFTEKQFRDAQHR